MNQSLLPVRLYNASIPSSAPIHLPANVQANGLLESRDELLTFTSKIFPYSHVIFLVAIVILNLFNYLMINAELPRLLYSCNLWGGR